MKIANGKSKLMDRLDRGELILCDGGMLFQLERRGYVAAGVFTPEVVLQNPDAVRGIHKEALRGGSDIIEAYTFNATDDRLNKIRKSHERLDVQEINDAGCTIAKEIAEEYDSMVAGPLSFTLSYKKQLGKEAVQDEYRQQLDALQKHQLDLHLLEFVDSVEEGEWALEVMTSYEAPAAVTMCIGPKGDFKGVPVEECALRLVRAGADIIGINCRFDPDTCLETVLRMKEAVTEAGLKTHYLVQPCGYRTKGDVGMEGFLDLPEFPLALESRQITRWDAHKFARKAYENGIRFIGGCCGCDGYHIRAMADELHKERGRIPESSVTSGLYGESMKNYGFPKQLELRSTKDYWFNVVPKLGNI